MCGEKASCGVKDITGNPFSEIYEKTQPMHVYCLVKFGTCEVGVIMSRRPILPVLLKEITDHAPIDRDAFMEYGMQTLLRHGLIMGACNIDMEPGEHSFLHYCLPVSYKTDAKSQGNIIIEPVTFTDMEEM
jgi:hypothetical protein